MIAIIINPRSGPRRDDAGARAEAARAALRDAGETGEVALTDRRGHARELAEAAVQNGARLIVAWGGDGTVNEVGGALVGRSTPLGIVPAGSGNGLASELKVERSPRRALAAAFAATPRAIDAGELGGRVFFNVAGIGFDAHVAACFDREPGRGFATYMRVSLRELLSYRAASYTIENGGMSSGLALLIALANAPQYGNGVRIAPGARVDDGKLDLVVYRERSRAASYWAIPKLFTGKAATVPGVTMMRTEHAVIACDAPITFHVDGEPVMGGRRVEARVRPGALHVAVR